MRKILTKKQALEQRKNLSFAMITRLSEITIGEAPEELSFDELIEARFFDADREIHIFQENGEWNYTCISEEDGVEFFDRESRLIAGLGTKLVTRKHIAYDKTDGQAYISDMRLVNWEG